MTLRRNGDDTANAVGVEFSQSGDSTPSHAVANQVSVPRASGPDRSVLLSAPRPDASSRAESTGFGFELVTRGTPSPPPGTVDTDHVVGRG